MNVPAHPACLAVDAQNQAGPVQEVRAVLDRTVADQTSAERTEITPHHSWARQGSEAVSINCLKPFHAMYVDALEHHCPPDPKADLKMLGDEYAKIH
jgi:hypothetical protein